MPASICNPRPVTHRGPGKLLESALLQVVISGYARSDCRSRKAAAEGVLEARKKWGVLFEYLQSLGTRGNNSEDVVPSVRGGGVAVPDWPFTIHLSPRSCTTFGDFPPLRAPSRYDSSSLYRRMRTSKRRHTRLVGCMDGSQ